MLKAIGALTVLALCGTPAAAHSVHALCKQEARGLKGAEYQKYMKVCVTYERVVASQRSCQPKSANGFVQARTCVASR
ncbi:hypothetical protein [Ramlibacter sp.]|uniref:hypothetical protein n=1 Tax=Ramlibacter sp. TaxID=1917967 RepID=UPI003D0F288D